MYYYVINELEKTKPGTHGCHSQKHGWEIESRAGVRGGREREMESSRKWREMERERESSCSNHLPCN